MDKSTSGGERAKALAKTVAIVVFGAVCYEVGRRFGFSDGQNDVLVKYVTAKWGIK